jgi:hypothetical protein
MGGDEFAILEPEPKSRQSIQLKFRLKPMTIKIEHAYQATFDVIYGYLTSEDFLRKKYEGIGSRNVAFRACGQEKDVFRIEWTREVPLNVPGFAKKFLHEWTQTEEIMDWTLKEDGTAHGDYQCRVGTIPGKLEGTFDLYPEGNSCVEAIEMVATVKIPIVGSKIAGLVEDDTARQLTKEYEFTQRFPGES